MLESRENYLEAILMLKQELGQVRSIDIARKLITASQASAVRSGF